MVCAWYMDTLTTDQRLEHHKSPPDFVSIEELFKKTGVEYLQINPETYAIDKEFAEIRRKRGYTYDDELTCSKECLENYEEQLKIFYTEHLHTNEEIRLVLDGSGYWDVRDKEDQWIRIKLTPGDMLVLPSGIYHRLTLDVNNYLRVRRFFIGDPVWVPHNRPSDGMDCRKDYLKKLSN